MPGSTIKWEVDGGLYPQRSELDFHAFEDDMDDAAIENMIWDLVQHDFDQRITYVVTNVEEVVEAVKAHFRNKEEE